METAVSENLARFYSAEGDVTWALFEEHILVHAYGGAKRLPVWPTQPRVVSLWRFNEIQDEGAVLLA